MAEQAKLSKRQQNILQFLWKQASKAGPPPSYEEIMSAVALKSKGAVSYQIGRLEEAGYLLRDAGKARALSLTDKARTLFDVATDVARIPLLGDIVASHPVTIGHDDFAVYDAVEDYVSVCRDMLPGRAGDLFALRVRGDSMIDAMVNDDDVVIMRPVTEVHDGDMVAVWLRDEQEMTLKHFYREGYHVRLQPANPTLEPIYTPAANVDVQGKVVLVVRQVP